MDIQLNTEITTMNGPLSPLLPINLQTRDELLTLPDVLNRELISTQSKLHALVLDNFQSHVSNFRCEADVTKDVSFI